MVDNSNHVYDWPATQALLRREVGLSHPQGPSRPVSSGAIVSHASSASTSFIPHPEVASLQLQLQEAHQMLAASKSQGFYGTIAESPVGSPQPIPGHQYPFNAGYGLHPPPPTPPSNLCHSYPFCKFERCNFSHLTDGHLDNEMDIVQNMSLAEIRVLNPPLARNEPFRPRASPVLLAEYNRLMTQRSSSLGKRKGL